MILFGELQVDFMVSHHLTSSIMCHLRFADGAIKKDLPSIPQFCWMFLSENSTNIRKNMERPATEEKSKPHSRWSSIVANSQFQRTCRSPSGTSLPSEPGYFQPWSIDTKAAPGRRYQRQPRRRPGSSCYLAIFVS